MPVKAGQIVIDVSAGTAKMILDFEKAKAGVREFGASATTSTKAVNAELKALEGGWFNNTRAAGFFLTTIKGLGPIIQAAFPVVGAIAFAGVLVEAGKKVYEFFKDLKSAAEKANGAWDNLLKPLQLTNDQLAVTNAKLDQDIAKLRLKPENNLALALAEAKVAADQLHDSLDKDFEAMYKLLDAQHDNSFVAALKDTLNPGYNPVNPLTWIGPNQKSSTAIQKLMQEIGGEEGFGGDYAQREKDFGARRNELDAHPANAAEINRNWDKHENTILDERIKEIDSILAGGVTQRASELLNHMKQGLQDKKVFISLTDENTDKNAIKNALELQKALEALHRAYLDIVGALQLRLNALDSEKAISESTTESAETTTRGNIEAARAMEELNKKVREHVAVIYPMDEAVIQWMAHEEAAKQATAKNALAMKDLNASLKEKIDLLKASGEAIGEDNYATLRQLAIQEAVAKATKDLKAGPHKDAVTAAVTAGAGTEFDLEHFNQAKRTLDRLGDSIRMTNAETQARDSGTEAARRAKEEEEILTAVRGTGFASFFIAAKMREDFDAKHKLQLQDEVVKILDEVRALEALGNAWGGAQAQRNARNEAKYAEMRKNDQGGLVPAEMLRDQQEEANKVTEEADNLAHRYTDQYDVLQKQLIVIKQKIALGDHSLATAAAERDILRDQTENLSQQALQMKTATGAWDAFVLHSKATAKQPADVLYDAMNESIDKISDQLGDLFSGKKTSWGKMFQELGGSIEKELIKGSLQKAIGGIFGGKAAASVKGGAHAVTQAPGDTWHVWMDNPPQLSTDNARLPQLPGAGASGIANGLGGLFGKLGGFASDLGGIFGGGGGGTAVSSTLSFPMLANGGDVSPYSSYIVGEHAPEIFQPRTSGTIIPLDKMGGGASHTYNIDARGADIGAANRTAQAIDMAHTSAIHRSVQATQERSKRVPQRRN